MTRPPLIERAFARRHVALLAIALGCAAPEALAQSAAAGVPAVAARGPTGAATPVQAPPPANAASTPAGATTQGDKLRRQGNAAWKENRYAEALGFYQEAAKIAPEPKNFYNLAAAYEKLGRYGDALPWLLRFKTEASQQQLADVPGLGVHIDALRKRVTVLKVHVNVPGARVLVGDTMVGTQPADRPLEAWVNEGRASVEILHEGYQPYRKDHTLLGGSSLELDVQLNRQAPPTTVVEKAKTIYVTSTPFWSQWWFWAGAGAVVLGGAATVYALSTEKDPSKSTFGPGQIPTAGRSGLSGLSLRF